MRPWLQGPANRWLEPLLAFIVVAGLTRALVHLAVTGYLPQPYFYDPYDMWMDWFNTADWARDSGMYDSWGTIYPPLSFVFLKIAGLPHCYTGGGGAGTAFPARDCDWLGLALLHGFFALNVVLIARTYFKIDPRTAVARALALSIGWPMTSALERGNLMIVTFTCFVLAFGPILASARLRWVAVALSINFKLYLIAALVPQLLRRRWRWFEGAMIATVAIYLVTYCMLGRGSPLEIYNNVVVFSDNQAGGPLDLWSATTYQPMLTLLRSTELPISSLIGSDFVEYTLVAIPIITLGVQLTLILAAVGVWIRPESVPMYRITNLGMSLALITSETSGYTATLIVFFVFMERWRGIGVKYAIVMCYVVCFPFDYILDRAPPVILNTYFLNNTVIVNYYIMLGPFIRPLIYMSIPFALACVTIRDVWRDIQTQGWQSRWRYRRDAPIMTGPGGYPGARLDANRE